MSRYELPWNEPTLSEWMICGMNHYRLGGERRLFVSMTRAELCIMSEGPDEEEVFRELSIKATALNLLIAQEVIHG
jgi:hypothetical protein